MKLLYIYKICYLLLISFSSQDFDYQKIKNETLALNRENKFKEAQNKLFAHLQNDKADPEDKIKILLLIANNYRSLNDYPSCINYQKKAIEIAKKNTVSDSLIAKIRAENSFAYFDSSAYQKADSIMHIIQNEQYANQEPVNKAYLIMQKGYLHFLNKEWGNANIAYKEALSILKKYAPCHSVVVEVKQIELLCSKNLINQAKKNYEGVIKKADSCHIIKYKIHATEQFIKGLIQQNALDNIKKYNQDLNNYNKIYNRDKELREVHETESNFLQRQQKKLKNKSTREKIVFFFIIIILVLFCVGLIFRYLNNKKSHQQLSKEISQMREELKAYAINLEPHDSKKTNKKHPVTEDDNKQKIEDSLKLDNLNQRQKEILELIVKGNSNKEIAEKLFITESTVKYHIKNIYKILGVKNRKEVLIKHS